MDPDSITQLIIFIMLLACSAFFSASETALMSMSKIRVRSLVDEKVKGADKIVKLLENPNQMLSAILVCNNLVNISASALVTSMALKHFNNIGIGISTGIVTFLVLVFGEVTPKTLAAQNSERVAFFVSRPVSIIIIAFTPAVVVLNFISSIFIKLLGGDAKKTVPLITEAEIKTMVQVGQEEGILEHDEHRMIYNVFEFGDSAARDIMVTRMDMVAANINATYDELVDVFRQEKFSRVPVYEDSIDNIVGILHCKDLILTQFDDMEFKVNDLMRDPFFTYETKSTSDLFAEMRSKFVSMAIVLDEYGGTSGLITIEDLVEEIVGDISDEYDDDHEEIVVIKEDEYIIEGSARLEDVNEMIGTNLESSDFDSIGGFVIGVLGRFPDEGEEVEDNGIKFRVEEIDKNHIEKIRVFT